MDQYALAYQKISEMLTLSAPDQTDFLVVWDSSEEKFKKTPATLSPVESVTVYRKYSTNSSQETQSLCHLEEGYVVGQICETNIFASGHQDESGGRFKIAEVRSSAYSGTINTFSSDGYLEGRWYRFSPILDAGGYCDIRTLGISCVSGVSGWHSRMENIVTWAKAQKIILTGKGTAYCTETVNLEGVMCDFDALEFQGGTARTTGGAFPATFYTGTYTNREVTFTTGTPVVVNLTAHGLSANEAFKFGVSNGGRLPSGGTNLAFNTTYYVKEVLSANTFSISSSPGGTALACSSAGTGTFWLFQATDQSNMTLIDFPLWNGKLVRKGVIVKAGGGIGWSTRDNLTQRIRVRGDGNFDFTTLSSCIGILHSGDRGPHGKYDYSSNYCYVAVGNQVECEKHTVYVRGVYVNFGLYCFSPTSGTPDSMNWQIGLADYWHCVYEAEGLDSYQRYDLILEPRKDPSQYALNEGGDDAPTFLIRNGKCSILSGIMRGHNGINCIFVSGRTNTTGTSNRAWADTLFFDNLQAIHGHGTFLNAQNIRRLAGVINLKDWEDPNVEDGHSPAACFKLGRVVNASGLRVYGVGISNTKGIEIGSTSYYSRDAHLGYWAIDMGSLVQFDTGGNEVTGASGNPTTLDARDFVKGKNVTIDLSGSRGKGTIRSAVTEKSRVIIDSVWADMYTLTTEAGHSCNVETGAPKTREHTAAGAVTLAHLDDIVLVNKTSGAATAVNLPANPLIGRVYTIKDAKGDANSNNITLTPAAGNIDGAGTYVMSTNYQAARIAYNGTQWNVL